MVYVINIDGKPLMPTTNAIARLLLKQNKAKVKTVKPFTIQLLYKTKNYTQPIKLGIDSGYLNIGFSAITDKKELISGEVELLQGQSERLKKRAMYRKQRKNRKRYRKPRFDNRKIDKGWLAPSIKHKLDSHFRFIEYLKSRLPITSITVEIANFDIQKIKNPNISKKEYQEGEQKGFYNLREYIFHRDNHTCQICKTKDKPLEVHHIGYYREDRTNRPSNLLTVCIDCHTPTNHKKGNILYELKPKLKPFKEETFMTTIRRKLVKELNCKSSYGYITKGKRIEQGLEKTYYNDAFIIAEGKKQTRIEPLKFKQIRRNNRSL